MRTYLWLVLLVSVTAVSCQPTVDILRYFQNPEPQLTLKPKLTTADRIAQHGYPAETHEVTTEDGYIITFFRIPYSHKLQNQNEYRPIVLIQHGLFSSSDGWMLNGPNDGIGFNLVDAGYDVWFGNARGNTYNRRHVSRSTNHPYFWRFSWHEIGHYDIAAMIDYALATNGQGQKAIHYIGHSQGTTVFFTLMSTRPEYNEKIKTAHMLAPVAFMSNMSDKLVRTLAPYLGHHNGYSGFFSDQEFVPYNELFTKLGYNACAPQSKTHKLCSSIAYMVEGPESNTNLTSLTILAETHPAGCSTNQILHYMQEQQSGCFCMYDYGPSKNLKLYGQATPLDYPLDKITSELHLWYSDNDDSVAVEDVERLADILPNRILHHMEDPTWSHGDFTGHIEVKKYINEPIIDIMNKYEEKM
ncbi:lipase 3-like [Musca vetustissima]|uniref:lipase 3-like n=1 Tax=Musca vetustissima TaxID=27455 RepID=UPI002AB5E107|nr:lipase 3-like [Musca vetustissima]